MDREQAASENRERVEGICSHVCVKWNFQHRQVMHHITLRKQRQASKGRYIREILQKYEFILLRITDNTMVLYAMEICSVVTQYFPVRPKVVKPVLTVSTEATCFGKLFHMGVILLIKLNFHCK